LSTLWFTFYKSSIQPVFFLFFLFFCFFVMQDNFICFIIYSACLFWIEKLLKINLWDLRRKTVFWVHFATYVYNLRQNIFQFFSKRSKDNLTFFKLVRFVHKSWQLKLNQIFFENFGLTSWIHKTSLLKIVLWVESITTFKPSNDILQKQSQK
jgi:hypothetical protein